MVCLLGLWFLEKFFNFFSLFCSLQKQKNRQFFNCLSLLKLTKLHTKNTSFLAKNTSQNPKNLVLLYISIRRSPRPLIAPYTWELLMVHTILHDTFVFTTHHFLWHYPLSMAGSEGKEYLHPLWVIIASPYDSPVSAPSYLSVLRLSSTDLRLIKCPAYTETFHAATVIKTSEMS